jgi:hypothetical protein
MEIKVELELGKETPRKRRFEEVDGGTVLGTIYVDKSVLKDLDYPVTIEITIKKLN